MFEYNTMDVPLQILFILAPHMIYNKRITKYITWSIIITSLFSTIVFFIIRIYILQDINYPIDLIVLDTMHVKFKIDRDILSGIFTLINHYSWLNFIQNRLELPIPLKDGVGDGLYTMDQDKIVGDSIEPSNISTSAASRIILGLSNEELIDLMKKSNKGFQDELTHLAKNLKSCTEHYKKLPSSFSMHDQGAIAIVTNHLQGHAEILNTYLKLRLSWLDTLRINLSLENKLLFKSKHTELEGLHGRFLDDTANLVKISDPHEQARQFFIILNTYRNKTFKIIHMLDSISHKDIRDNMPDLYKNAELKKIVNVDVPKLIKEVESEDSYLKSRISELINVKKK